MATPKKDLFDLARPRRRWYGRMLERRLICDVCGLQDSHIRTYNDLSVRVVCKACKLERTIKLDSLFRAFDFVDQADSSRPAALIRRDVSLAMRDAAVARRNRREFLTFRAEVDEELRVCDIEWDEFRSEAMAGTYSSPYDAIDAILLKRMARDRDEPGSEAARAG